MANQICFNLLLFLLGYFFLNYFRNISFLLRCFLSYFMGLSLWGFLSSLLISLQIHLNIYSVLALFLGLNFAFSKLKCKNNIIYDLKKNKGYIFFFVIGLSALTVLFYKYNTITLEQDSYRYALLGEALADLGYYNKDLFSWSYSAQGRMSFLPLIFAGGKMFNIDFFYTFLPVSSVLLTILIPIIIFELNGLSIRDLNVYNVFLTIFCFLTIVTIPVFYKYAFFINNNLLLGAFFLISFATVLLFNKTENDDLLFLSAIFLGTTVLQRNEMTFIASIIIILALNQEKINIKNYALFLSTFLTVALSWHAYRFILLGLEKHGHGWGGLQLLAFFLYLLSFILVYFKNLRENIARNSLDISVYVSAISLASLTYIYPVGTGETLKALILLSAKIIYKHDWSVFWYVLSFIIVTDLMFINSHLGKIFVKVLFVLLMFRIMLYTIPWLSTTNLHKFQFQSGQRIMIQFFPIGYCYIYYVLFLLSKKLSLTKTH